MFTLEQIQAAHAKVKTGADFPKYIQALIALGVRSYDTFVIDGHSEFHGADGYAVVSPAKYPEINITGESNTEKFAKFLRRHQQGETNYLIFCGHAAETGVQKWTVDTAGMSCTYFDSEGNQMLREAIPGA